MCEEKNLEVCVCVLFVNGALGQGVREIHGFSPGHSRKNHILYDALSLSLDSQVSLRVFYLPPITLYPLPSLSVQTSEMMI